MKPPPKTDPSPLVVIRSARAEDCATIVDFNLRLAWESEHKRLDEPTLTRGVKRALAAPDQCRYFLAELEGQIVGQTMITLELTDWRDGVLWWLQSVYVPEAFRGRGIFRAIFQHIEALARRTPDVRGLRLYVEQANHRAQRVYKQMGMRPGGYHVYELDWALARSAP